MEYKELYRKYQKLLEENKRLRMENEDFKIQLGLTLPVFGSETHAVQEDQELPDQFNGSGQVTNSSSPQYKINLFMSLFRGRDDVYEKRWQNKEGSTRIFSCLSK
ncbi:MAG: hypothetical protein NC238_09685 [Dehalobacter sp.]|nr:hypothetical protein [Dehalobacter sp.]